MIEPIKVESAPGAKVGDLPMKQPLNHTAIEGDFVLLELKRPCPAGDFIAYYEAQGYEIVYPTSAHIVAVRDGEQVDSWSIDEGATLAMREIGAKLNAAVKPLLDWYNSLPISARYQLTGRHITELPKGKRHKPSRYRY